MSNPGLVHVTLDQEVQIQAVAGDNVVFIVLCSWARHFTLRCSHSASLHLGVQMDSGELYAGRHPGGIKNTWLVLLVTSC